jgi:hypothetical protein
MWLMFHKCPLAKAQRLFSIGVSKEEFMDSTPVELKPYLEAEKKKQRNALLASLQLMQANFELNHEKGRQDE